MNDEQRRPEDRPFEIIITGKTLKDIALIEPPPLPNNLLLDDLFLGDELFDELGLLSVIDETADIFPDFMGFEV